MSDTKIGFWKEAGSIAQRTLERGEGGGFLKNYDLNRDALTTIKDLAVLHKNDSVDKLCARILNTTITGNYKDDISIFYYGCLLTLAALAPGIDTSSILNNITPATK